MYVYGAFIYPCENHFDYHQVCCAGLCFAIENRVLGLFDQFAHTLILSTLIVIVNLGLCCRVVLQKHQRMRRSMEWRQHRKMIIQFVSVAVLYMSSYLTYGSLQCYQLINGPTNLSTTI
ncbi:unnamed protein product [Rotaria socialis]|nr:unnamed protein product [Rotaria socialis]CAF4687384.1 unnamed protein product [Rotaria socialis]CAF4932804.1 unnamed protein product [Rotaria socialis]